MLRVALHARHLQEKLSVVQEAVKAELTALNQVHTVGLLRGWRVRGQKELKELSACTQQGGLRGAWAHELQPVLTVVKQMEKGRLHTLCSHTTLTHCAPQHYPPPHCTQ